MPQFTCLETYWSLVAMLFACGMLIQKYLPSVPLTCQASFGRCVPISSFFKIHSQRIGCISTILFIGQNLTALWTDIASSVTFADILITFYKKQKSMEFIIQLDNRLHFSFYEIIIFFVVLLYPPRFLSKFLQINFNFFLPFPSLPSWKHFSSLSSV